MIPKARQDKMLVQKIGTELIVYDQQRHLAHSLNQPAALVWQHCDGQRTVADIAALLRKEMNLPADEDLVWLTLDRLERAHLLQEVVEKPRDRKQISRRQMTRKMGQGALILLAPVVTSIAAPTPAMAQSACRSVDCCW